jgi:hypothetical protein
MEIARRRLAGWALVLLFGLTSAHAAAQQRFLLEGIFDAELHRTDEDSILLSGNEGDTVALGRLQVWSAYQISAGLQIYALAELETDNSSGDRHNESEIEQFALRYTSRSTPYFFIEAGRILSPLDAFSNRHLSTQNPLIGQAYVYSTSYPWGIQVAGSSAWLDYRAAVIDQPAIDESYMAFEPGSAYRPALGAGVTFFTGLRIGASWTSGPYLNHDLEAWLPPGTSWRDFDQRNLGFDFQFSRGYLELNGLLVFSEYEVPYRDDDADTTAWYLELKYTWTPRFYGAVRFEKNEASLRRQAGESPWPDRSRKFRDLEIGLGYRFSPDTQIKAAYRHDRWNEGEASEYATPSGHSLSLQLSHHFDAWSWFEK